MSSPGPEGTGEEAGAGRSRPRAHPAQGRVGLKAETGGCPAGKSSHQAGVPSSHLRMPCTGKCNFFPAIHMPMPTSVEKSPWLCVPWNSVRTGRNSQGHCSPRCWRPGLPGAPRVLGGKPDLCRGPAPEPQEHAQLAAGSEAPPPALIGGLGVTI